jgi:DNA-binding transcriptional ArsR family regulator
MPHQLHIGGDDTFRRSAIKVHFARPPRKMTLLSVGSFTSGDCMNNPLQPQHCARILRVLADPDRLRIIECLRTGPKNVSELAEMLDALLAKISHHLGVLKHADIVLDEKKGRFVVYRLNPDVYVSTAPSEDAEHLNLGCCRLEIRKAQKACAGSLTVGP